MEINSLFPENWREIVARNILTERERLNLNQRQLSEKMGKKDPTTISKWENAEGTFNLDVLIGLCRLFGRTPNELLCEDLIYKPPQPPPKKGKHTEGGEELQRHVEKELQEMDAGGVSMASESPPPKAEKEEIHAMKKQMLEMMMKLEEMTQ